MVGSDTSDSGFAAAVPSGTYYTINDSQVQVDQEDAIALLVDDLVTEGDDTASEVLAALEEATSNAPEEAGIAVNNLTDESRDEFWSQTNPYSDVSADDWYNNAVSTLTNAGIIDGYEDGTFKPNGNITRAEFATITARFFEASYDGGNRFPTLTAIGRRSTSTRPPMPAL